MPHFLVTITRTEEQHTYIVANDIKQAALMCGHADFKHLVKWRTGKPVSTLTVEELHAWEDLKGELE